MDAVGTRAKHEKRGGDKRRHAPARKPAKHAGKTARLFVGGPHAVEAAVAGPHEVVHVFIEEGPGKRPSRWHDEARRRSIPVSVVGRGECDRMAETRSQGVAAELRYAYADVGEVVASEKSPVLVLDGIVDPHNLGAILRTAEAAGAAGAVLPARRSAAVTSTVARTSAGAALSLPVARVANLVQAMRNARDSGLWLVGLDHRAERVLMPADLGARVGLVLGGEAEGLHRLVAETCDETARLPMAGRTESLNASVAAAVAVYRLCEARLFGPPTG